MNKTTEVVKTSMLPIPGFQWGGGMNRWSTGHFQGSENILYDTLMVYT